jgi:hypothetical protein
VVDTSSLITWEIEGQKGCCYKFMSIYDHGYVLNMWDVEIMKISMSGILFLVYIVYHIPLLETVMNRMGITASRISEVFLTMYYRCNQVTMDMMVTHHQLLLNVMDGTQSHLYYCSCCFMLYKFQEMPVHQLSLFG